MGHCRVEADFVHFDHSDLAEQVTSWQTPPWRWRSSSKTTGSSPWQPLALRVTWATGCWEEMEVTFGKVRLLLWMEEIRHHLGWLKPCKEWDKPPINWGRFSSVHSMRSDKDPSNPRGKFPWDKSSFGECKKFIGDYGRPFFNQLDFHLAGGLEHF